MKINKLLLNVYLFLLFVITTYQDFPLVNYVGEIGRTPILLLLPIFIIVELHSFFMKKKIILFKFEKYLLIFSVYISFISVVYVLISFFTYGYMVLGENIFIKSIKGLLYFTLIFLYVRHLKRVFSLFSTIKEMFYPFFFFNVYLLILLIIEYNKIPNAFSALHSIDSPYYRIRLLTFESSWTGTIIIIFAGIQLFINKHINSNFKKVIANSIIMILLILYVYITGSKGFLLTFIILPVYVFYKSFSIKRVVKKIQLLLLFLTPVVFLIIFLFIKDQLLGSLYTDLNHYSSVATRLSTILASIIIVLQNPFGTGTGAYLFYFQNTISEVPQIINSFLNFFNINIKLNFQEIHTYTVSDKNIGIKSGFFQWLMLGGIGTILFFYYLLKYFYSNVKQSYILSIILSMVVFSVTIYVTLEIKYELWLFLSFLETVIIKDFLQNKKQMNKGDTN